MPADFPWFPVLIGLSVLIAFSFLILLVKRYKRCPSNRILVIYGKVQDGRSAKCLHGGGAFVWPLIQDFDFLSLDPMQIEIPLRGALSSENIRVNVPSVFTVAVSTEPAVMQNAAERLLGLKPGEITKQAEDIIFGQLRQVIASMAIEDINRDRDKFLESIHMSLGPELEKIGLLLINVNITDITDESGYIEAIGRKAASEAIQQAEIDVAEQQKLGSIGVADAQKEQAVRVAQAERLRDVGKKEAERNRTVEMAELDRDEKIGQQTAEFDQESQVKEAERQMRVRVAEANADAVAGENASKANIADADAKLKIREAEAFQVAETRKREADAAVREAQYVAETRAAEALSAKIEKEKRAELEAVAIAEKAKQIVDAQGNAEQRKIAAEAEAFAIFAKLDAEARGEYEMLAKKADGLREIVDACGGAQQAFQMLMLEDLPKLAETASQAISNIKFDKVVVWDGGNGKGGGTAGFLQNLAHSLPPMLSMMKDVGGVEMPAFLGKLMDGQGVADEATTSEPVAALAADGSGAADVANRTTEAGKRPTDSDPGPNRLDNS